MGNRVSIPIGTRFGRWTVIGEAGDVFVGNKKVRKKRSVFCRCDCGNIGVRVLDNLRSGYTKSCGCFKSESSKSRETTHGMSKTKTYNIWRSMLQRCKNQNSKFFVNYGGRGIDVCKKWESFENFYKDMGNPAIGLTLDRIDNNKGYSKENCRWATRYEQGANKRNNRRIMFGGKCITISQWAAEVGVSVSTITTRLKNGWSAARALTEPSYIGKNQHSPCVSAL